ncbi:MAG: hypothetical protein EBZ48_08475, partial [Proteobacteria bacterium]|nr:hypothetical protein [Pseudomonadota bacterium]
MLRLVHAIFRPLWQESFYNIETQVRITVDSKFPHYLRPLRQSQQDSKPAATGKAEGITPRGLALCSVPEARSYIDEEQAHRIGVLPLGVVDILGAKTLTAAVAHGSKIESERALRFAV